ncbi:immunoglobulin lambda-like polypeptide 1 [Melanotaenia boesemani]|uniref:immunoglobulin lambda-like polypeptide 1 n=1 Tax=Melanotaenia boesemani TaxID=1250792 RepID=UPI001C059782|nr:immunoglobulin lambda-like polypeptide 1 [Melanotaenia boesemani]
MSKPLTNINPIVNSLIDLSGSRLFASSLGSLTTEILLGIVVVLTGDSPYLLLFGFASLHKSQFAVHSSPDCLTLVLTRSPADRFLYQSFSPCGGRWYFIFGSGTKLYVTEEQVVKPVVNVCPIESNVHQEGRSSLLCLASAMFPPLVQFSWKRQKEDGSLEELLPAEGQFRGSRQSAVIRVVDGDALSRYKYICYVKHEGGTVEAQTQQEVPASSPPASPPPVYETTPPLQKEEIFPPSDPAATSVPVLHPVKLSVSFQSELRVKLLLLRSTVLIVKSLVYCCGLSLLMILRNKGPSTNCTYAD